MPSSNKGTANERKEFAAEIGEAFEDVYSVIGGRKMKLRGSRVNRRPWIHLAAPLVLVLVVASISSGAEKRKHTIKVSFNYDFRLTPACSPKTKGACVQEFVLYDISAGVSKRAKLMEIPVPRGATGFVKGITATTPRLDFESGKHLIAVVARMPNGVESKTGSCNIWVTIP
ncbi:MAG: hypothetical protein ACRD4X_00170 [Candidatus Acidiferrales bacterium]